MPRYRRPLRLPRRVNKPLVIDDEDAATLSDWIACYGRAMAKSDTALYALTVGVPIDDDARRRYPLLCARLEYLRSTDRHKRKDTHENAYHPRQ